SFVVVFSPWLGGGGSFVFFSSRRRHTRFSRDWSSDVCSSDLKQEGVSVATLGRSLDHLQVEGYITTSRRGTFVANAPEVAPSSYDRITRVLRTGSVLAEGETMIVTAAELIRPPQYVAEIFDLDDGAYVVRRQWHTGKGAQRTGLFVTWYPAHFAAAVPELLSTARGREIGRAHV